MANTSDNPNLSSVGTSFLSGLSNAVTGSLSKAADTAIDNWSVSSSGKTVGSVYPTGQVSPAAATAPDGTNAQAAAAAAAKLKQYAIIGGIALGAVLFGVLILSRR